MKGNVYLSQVHLTLPRLLSLFDRAPISKTYGFGDRQYWAWKLVDFPNATFQGAAHGLARLVLTDLLPPSISKNKILILIGSIVQATKRMTRKNGSLEEAFPFESSYCVTALVAYDLLKASELLAGVSDPSFHEDVLAVVEPLIRFLQKSRETHAFISNHLATAAAALYLWESLTKERCDDQANAILQSILSHQSREGWYNEYGGADPGYQSLATYYLADIYRLRPTEALKVSLADSLVFLKHFVHPDGSFGGVYGSRNTRFYFPGGIEFLREISDSAVWIADAMRHAIEKNTTVTLNAMDAPNLVPMFNSYCWAADLARTRQPTGLRPDFHCERLFDDAGIFVRSNAKSYFWLGLRKGGAWGFYDVETASWQGDHGALYRTSRGDVLTGQEQKAKFDRSGAVISLKIPLIRHEQMLPTPFKFLILRVLNLTVMRLPMFSRIAKDVLVRLLIQRHRRHIANCSRVFDLDAKSPLVKVSEDEGLIQVDSKLPFYEIHMASQGYWQTQDFK